MSILTWLAKKLFGFAASPASEAWLDDSARLAKDYLDQLQEQGRPVPLPSSTVRYQQEQIASATHPPTCPPSQAPSAPPVSMSIDRHVSPPETPRPLPYGRTSSGPPPRMSPPPVLPIPPLPPPPVLPTVPKPPRPKRRR